MAVERPIGEPNTDIEIEGVTIETPDMEVEAIEMQEDGSAIVNPEDQARELMRTNPNYQIKPISIPDKKSMEPVFAIKITEEMLESFATHKAKGGLVSNIDIFEVA